MPDNKICRDPRSGVLRIDVPPGAYGAAVDKACEELAARHSLCVCHTLYACPVHQRGGIGAAVDDLGSGDGSA